MGGPRRLQRALAIFSGVVVLLVAATVLLVPVFLRTETVRTRIESAASSALGGEVRIGRIDLRWLPHPEVAINDLVISVPEKARGTVPSVRISPAVLSLLRGRLRITRIRADGPDLNIDLPEAATAEEPASSPPPLAGLTPLLPSLSRESAGLTVEVSRAHVAVFRNGRPFAELRDLAVSVAASSKPRTLHADAKATALVLSLRRGERRALEVRGLSFAGAIDSGEGVTEGSLSRFSVESPRMHVEGTARARSDGPQVELTARGSSVDVTALREKLLAFAGDDPTLRGIFSVLRGGTLTSFSLDTKGRTAAELGTLDRMSIRGTLAGGKVRIESVGLNLEEARGEITIERWLLSAEHAAARIGNSRAWDGSVRVGLAEGDDRLRVEALVQSDLSELPPILSRALRQGSLRDEISLVENLSGRATGRLTLENRSGSLKTRVSVSEMQLSATYARIPWPVRIREGTFSYEGERIGLKRLSGSLGASTFSDLGARLRLGDLPLIEELSGRVEASLDEFHPWVSSREGMATLRKMIPELRGSVGLSVTRLSGPISRLREWHGEAEGKLRDVVLTTSLLPTPLEVPGADVRVDAETVGFTGLAARTMDAELLVSGAVNGYREGVPKVDATAEGEVGPEAVRWIWEKASLPAALLPSAPFALRDVRVGLAEGNALSVAGSFNLKEGPRLTLDLTVDREGTDLRRLTVADGTSDASISFRSRAAEIGVGFSGWLEASTIGKVLSSKKERQGRIQGDVRGLLPRAHPEQAKAEGTLEATNIEVPTPAGDVLVERLALWAEESRFSVTASSLLLDGQRFSVTGSATFREQGLGLDLDVVTGDLSWEKVEKVFDRMKERKEEHEEMTTGATPAGGGPPRLGPSGVLRFSIDSFSWRGLEWKPVVADLNFEKGSAAIAVRKAALCGVSTTGQLRFLGGGTLAVSARVAAAGPDINAPFACLGLERVRMTGRYEAILEVEGHGTTSELPRALRGPLWFWSSGGKIGQASVLTRLLGALNATEVFAGRAAGLLGSEIPYKEISIAGEMSEGRALLREATLNAPAFTMAGTGRVGYLDRSVDLVVLSHPFSTMDKIVQKVPVVRYILGGSLLAVAATVSGTLDDPKVSVTPGRDVSEGLIRMAERTLKLPVRLFTPPSPEK